MPEPITATEQHAVGHLLLRGWRKGRAMGDTIMWSMLQISLILPATLLVAGNALTTHPFATILASPAFWLSPLVGFVPFIARLHYLATRIGCVRQINVSEDGQPSPCQIDLGHRECCRHIGPDENKTACPYWKPELILD